MAIICDIMSEVEYIDRATKRLLKEKVYGKKFIEAFYGDSISAKLLSFFVLPIVCHIPFFSKLYGTFQKKSTSRKKVIPFIKEYNIDTDEFQDPVDAFRSFNDFFIRKLKPACRPIAKDPHVLALPADGRYLAYENLKTAGGFFIKGRTLSLEKLLNDDALFQKYQEGSLLMARLCPTDYHRYHFPCDCTPSATRQINGPLFSVNPIALKKNIGILSENRRVLTQLKTEHFGEILYIEVGATYVGSIQQTFAPHKGHQKGDEKGYFEFGGSCLLLLFENGKIKFDADLLYASKERTEMRGLMGQSFATRVV